MLDCWAIITHALATLSMINMMMNKDDNFPGETADYEQSRRDRTTMSDITDSACSETMERNVRNRDIIESPPTFLMNDDGPPRVIYNGVLENSMSFYTTYSAAATEVRTVMTKVRDVSMDLSVVHEHHEAGFEINYEDTSFAASKASKHKHNDIALIEAGLGIGCAHGPFDVSTASKDSEIVSENACGTEKNNIREHSYLDGDRKYSIAAIDSEIDTPLNSEDKSQNEIDLDDSPRDNQVTEDDSKNARVKSDSNDKLGTTNAVKVKDAFVREISALEYDNSNKVVGIKNHTSKEFKVRNSSLKDDDGYGFEITRASQLPDNNTFSSVFVLAPCHSRSSNRNVSEETCSGYE